MTNKLKACVVGTPIEHSLSPIIHNAAYVHMNLNWEYSREEVSIADFDKRIAGLMSDGYVGFNITMPCKEAAYRFCDFVNGSAKRLKSVNTIVLRGGITHGYSTDGDGFVNFFIDEKIQISGRKIAVIGSGGAASSICDALYNAGGKVTICARNIETANEICEIVSSNDQIAFASINFVQLDKADEVISKANILINATPIGMLQGQTLQSQGKLDIAEKIPFNVGLLNSKQIVIDTIYHPLETVLLKRAKTLGCPVYNGINMLLYQAALSFELMTGLKPPINIMKNALLNEIENRQS